MLLNFWLSNFNKSLKFLAYGASLVIHLSFIFILFSTSPIKLKASDFVKVDLIGGSKEFSHKSSPAKTYKNIKPKIKATQPEPSEPAPLENLKADAKENSTISAQKEESYQIEQYLGNNEATNDQRAIYFTKIFRQISRFKSYPSLARQLSIQGQVKIQLTISNTGEVLDLKTLYFDHEILKQASIDAVKKAGNFDRPPFEILGPQFSLVIPMRYQLN
jgi:TonB family protein